jgi:hypothetical protein
VATFADGTKSDVTTQADWRSLDGGLTVVTAGLLRAASYGQHPLKVVYAGVQGSAAADAVVRVAPDGAFLVTVWVGAMRGEAFGARVQVSSSAGIFAGFTDGSGSCVLPASGDAVVTADREGFGSQMRSLIADADQSVTLLY